MHPVAILLLFLISATATAQSDTAPEGSAADGWGGEEWDDGGAADGWSDEAGSDAGGDWGDDWEDEPQSGWSPLTGFVEGAAGSRWEEDKQVGRYGTLLDLRWRIESGWENEQVAAVLKVDALYDGIEQEFTADIRDISLSFSPLKSLDMKVGRQVLTWGTGDLLFLNDLFPKDWVSFFAGRDDEYLKAPSNSFRATQYSKFVNVDFAWTPEFSSDIYIDGDRFSYFYPPAGSVIGQVPQVRVDEPDSKFSNGEFALRLFKTYKGVEYALYGYYGFFKIPSRFVGPDQLTFAPMSSLGGSLRGTLGPGLFNVEVSYYDSRDDGGGTDPFILNSQFRFLTGYEWEAARNFTVGLQYYLEHVVDYDELIANSPFPQFEPPENRHVITTRLTYRAMQEKLIWSFFAFVSPNDNDAYLRPVVSYRLDDKWTGTLGLNLLGGQDPYTFLGQFEDNSNAYLRVRYNY